MEDAMSGLVWRRAADELPEEGIFVLGRYEGDNWFCPSDQEGLRLRMLFGLRAVRVND